jgi:hypothetical protein
MATQTATMRLSKPTINADGAGAWPADLNLDMDLIDRAINQTVTVAIADTNVTLTADGSSGDQAIYAIYNFTGALTANRTVTLPANVKIGYAINATTGGHNVILSAGATTLAVTPTASRVRFEVDGSSNVTSPSVAIGGTTTNDNAATGLVGEYISAVVLAGAAVGTANGASTNITSISLTAGDWDVWGEFALASGATGIQGLSAGISTVSATLPSVPPYALWSIAANFGTGSMAFPTGVIRLSLSGTTTVYLVGNIAYSGGSALLYGNLAARRAR